MDVKSSAADLAVSGKHSFNDDYEYHVRILLSEMLSKKIRKPKPNTTEFVLSLTTGWVVLLCY